MRVTITARQRLAPALRAYAEEKLQRLGRHVSLHEVAMVIDHDERRVPPTSIEVISSLHHARLAAKVQADTVREAIDKVVDRADRQVLRRKDRVTDRKGRTGAGGIVHLRTARASDAGAPPDPRAVVGERRVRLRPMELGDAIGEMLRRNESHFLYLHEDRGDVVLLVRRPGGVEMVIGDTR